MESLMMEGKVEGKRPRGRSPMRWTDRLKEMEAGNPNTYLNSITTPSRGDVYVNLALKGRRDERVFVIPEVFELLKANWIVEGQEQQESWIPINLKGSKKHIEIHLKREQRLTTLFTNIIILCTMETSRSLHDFIDHTFFFLRAPLRPRSLRPNLVLRSGPFSSRLLASSSAMASRLRQSDRARNVGGGGSGSGSGNGGHTGSTHPPQLNVAVEHATGIIGKLILQGLSLIITLVYLFDVIEFGKCQENVFEDYKNYRNVNISATEKKTWNILSHLEIPDNGQNVRKDDERFFQYTRMSQNTFDYILQKVEPRLTKNWCNLHKQPILPEERLVITIRSPSIVLSESEDQCAFQKILEQALSCLPNKNIILAGDFNIKFGTSDKYCSSILDFLSTYGLQQMIISNTRNNNCIDNIFVNFNIATCEASVETKFCTDHLGQKIKFVPPGLLPTRSSKKVCRPITESERGIGELSFRPKKVIMNKSSKDPTTQQNKTSEDFGLIINPAKSKALLFGRKTVKAKVKLYAVVITSSDYHTDC
ncbi:unnamed protein product [Callosobruchus maculatus]|uniref:Endonuclease/exonuclease/phosphatase domain-containing protein n=1 Tax=Callosobruchus maculatus TaxID=64391 RepID=A0A653DFS9_CALMS|nr:unnamed protein product [Callosobruchus maculatus]